MAPLAAQLIAEIALIYAAIGVVFGLAFVAVGWKRIGASDATGTLGFRIVLIPGSALLWPWLLIRWIAKSWRGEIRIVNLDTLRRRALLFWLALIPIAAVVLVAAILMRPDRAASSYTTPPVEVEETSDANSGGHLREQ